ncbi:hypothetical protein [Bacillus thuringiensis]|uniref:hypothetical protein n=1 Tax=Bacillus thuringiensis TaxID=1428 RepID=UPI003B983225
MKWKLHVAMVGDWIELVPLLPSSVWMGSMPLIPIYIVRPHRMMPLLPSMVRMSNMPLLPGDIIGRIHVGSAPF